MNILNNMRTNKKLIGGFLIIAFLILAVSLVGYLSMQNMSSSMTSLYTNNTLPIEELGALKSTLLTVRGDTFIYLLDTDKQTDREESLLANIDKASAQMASFKDHILNGTEQEKFQIMEQNWQAYVTAVEQIIADEKSGDHQAALDGLKDTAPAPIARNKMADALDELVQEINTDASQANLNGIAVFNQSTMFMIGAGLLGILLSVGLGTLISNSITRPLGELVTAIQMIARGELDQRIKAQTLNRKDELGIMSKAFKNMLVYLEEMAQAAGMIARGDLTAQVSPKTEKDVLGNAFSKMINNLNNTLQQTNAVTGQVVQAVEQVRSVSQDLASNSQEQSAAVEQVASSVEETDGQVKESSENANIANQLAGQTTTLANVGQNKMTSLSESMSAIWRSSQEISKIMRVIDDIAFQTNLLALNAAVEAARAGQYGKGFAVVAQEVRNLAERSAKAAKSTAELIEDSNRRVQEGVSMTDETAQSLNEIVNNVVKVKDLVGEIAAASDEQTKALNQISQAITQVSQGTQSNSSQSEELASTADELGSLAERLKVEVNRFKLKKEHNNAADNLPQGVTFEMLQNALAKMQNNYIVPQEKPGMIPAMRNIDLDERGYGEF